MNKHKLWIILLSVFVSIILCDIILGWGMNVYRKEHKLPGDYLKIEYLLKEANEDMIILGSSVAINSYIPEIIEDSLSITCFNGGCNHQSPPFFLCMMDKILSKHTPKYFVLVFRTYELTENNLGRIKLLNPYYREESRLIDYYMEKDNDKASIFLFSNLYKYNTIWWRIALTRFMPSTELSYKGFVPHAPPKYAPTFVDESNDKPSAVNQIKVNSFISMIELCKKAGTKLIITIPPVYKKLPHSPNDIDLIETICREHDVTFFNYSQEPSFMNAPVLFYDNIHLLYSGSKTITDILIRDIKNKFVKN